MGWKKSERPGVILLYTEKIKFRVPISEKVSGFRLPVIRFLEKTFLKKPLYSVGRALSARPRPPIAGILLFMVRG